MENETQDRMFELHLGQPRPNTAVCQVTWCLNQKAWDRLRELGVHMPHMLLVVTRVTKNADSDEKLAEYDRHLAPLDQGFVQCQFNDPGLFRVFGTVLWSRHDMTPKACGLKKEIRRDLARFVDKSDGDYDIGFVSRYDRQFHQAALHCLDYVDSQDWLVPEGHFAKEPSAALRQWVGLFYSSRPRDECDFRRRVLTTVPLAAFGVLYLLGRWTLQIVFLLVGLLFGARGLRPKALLHPKDWPFMSVMGETGTVEAKFWWLTDAAGRSRTSFGTMVRIPFLWAMLGGFAWGLSSMRSERLVKVLPVVGVIFGIFLACVVIGFLVVKVPRWASPKAAKTGDGLIDRFSRWLVRREAAARARREAEFAKYYDRRLEPLICTMGGPKVGSTKALPKSHRTLKVAFYETKAQVCKPFRKNAWRPTEAP